MAVSTSKISVIVDADTVRMSSAMTQAAKSVDTLTNAQGMATAENGRLSNAAGRSQMAITQLVFAVDDAVTVFGTTGWAGAIRAASNNLTALAAVSGNMYALIATVAVTSIAQLTARYWEQNKALESQIDLLKRLREQQGMNRERLQNRFDLRDVQADTQRLRNPFLGRVLEPKEWEAETKRVAQEQLKVNREIEQARLALQESTREANNFRNATEEVVKLQKESEKKYIEQRDAVFEQEQTDRKRLMQLQGISHELGLQDRILKNMEKTVERVAANKAFSPFLFGAQIGGAGSIGGLGGLLKTLQLKTPPDLSLFNRLPQANISGSSGAISTINAAMTGPRNLADSQLMEIKKVEQNTRRAAENLGKLLGNKAIVVPVQ